MQVLLISNQRWPLRFEGRELTENLKLELLLTEGQPSTTLVFAFFTVSLLQVLCLERHPGEGGGAHSGKLKNTSHIQSIFPPLPM